MCDKKQCKREGVKWARHASEYKSMVTELQTRQTLLGAKDIPAEIKSAQECKTARED